MLGTMALAAVMAVAFAQNPNNTGNGTMSTTVQTTTASGQPWNGSISTFATTNNMSWEDAASAIALARAMNMQPNTIVTMRGTVNTPYYQMAPAFIISEQSGHPVADIWQAYQGGQTWMQIANQYNVPATYWNPTNVDTSNWTNDDFTNGVWHGVMANYYGMTPDDWVFFNTRKTPMNEVVVGEVVSRQDNTPIRDVMTAYGTHPDWVSVDEQYAANAGGAKNQSQQTQTLATMPVNNGNAQAMNPPNPDNTTTMTTTTSGATTQTNPPQGTTESTTTTNTTTTTTTPVPDQEPTTVGSTGPVKITPQDSPIQEWQINGASIVPYDYAYLEGHGGVMSTSSTSMYTLHRRHRRSYYRHYRHHRRHRR